MRKARHGAKALSLLFLSIGAGPSGPAVVEQQRTKQDCGVVRSKRVPVVLNDGRQVYVEPDAVVKSGNRLLVAGSPSYIWAGPRNSAEQSRNTLFGIVISLDGTADTIPSPLATGHLSNVRALALPDGTWAATFADVAPETQFNETVTPRTDAYWFGITDGQRWLTLEKLPASNGKLRSGLASRLVRSRTGYSVAMPIQLANGVDGRLRNAVTVFTRSDHGWRRNERVFEFVYYVSLDTTERGQLLLGSVRADASERPVSNDLVLYEQFADLRWHEVTRVEPKDSQHVHQPDVGWSGESSVATWLEASTPSGRARARAIVGATDPQHRRYVAISDDALQVLRVPDLTTPTWVALEWADSKARRISVVQRQPSGSTSRIAIPDPFFGYIGTSVFGSKLVVVGPVHRRDGKSPVVSLHLLTLEMTCFSE
jgi:hypothetical protein